MTPVRLGAVEYLNARPLVYGLEQQPRFDLRYDIPSECAKLLHAHRIDVGLIPSIEYLRGPQPYAFVPGPAVTSRGPVASVAIYTRLEPRDIKTIAMDTSSRTSVALATVLARRAFGIAPAPVPMPPDLDAMLASADAALIIGDIALFLDPVEPPRRIAARHTENRSRRAVDREHRTAVRLRGLGRLAGCAEAGRRPALQEARDAGVADSDGVARTYYPDDPAPAGGGQDLPAR